MHNRRHHPFHCMFLGTTRCTRDYGSSGWEGPVRTSRLTWRQRSTRCSRCPGMKQKGFPNSPCLNKWYKQNRRNITGSTTCVQKKTSWKNLYSFPHRVKMVKWVLRECWEEKVKRSEHFMTFRWSRKHSNSLYSLHQSALLHQPLCKYNADQLVCSLPLDLFCIEKQGSRGEPGDNGRTGPRGSRVRIVWYNVYWICQMAMLHASS